ncbi:MAG: hypothetical protein EA388_14660 [Nitriliruptor sp.]|nr:MAG: hypothetical protein EA388_14660 [Nitriliruptor sp.]
MTTWQPPERDPLVELADDAAQQAAVRARQEERDRREQAAEVATWVGTLRDLAERRLQVAITSGSGRVHRGSLIAVGVDHVAVRQVAGSVVLVARTAIRVLRPEPGAPGVAATGDREHAQDRTLIESLSRIAEERGEVAIYLADVADGLQGEVLGFGEDVLTLRLAGRDRGTVYIPIGAVEEVLWTPAP